MGVFYLPLTEHNGGLLDGTADKTMAMYGMNGTQKQR